MNLGVNLMIRSEVKRIYLRILKEGVKVKKLIESDDLEYISCIIELNHLLERLSKA